MEIKVGYFSLSHSLELRKKCKKKIFVKFKTKGGVNIHLAFFVIRISTKPWTLPETLNKRN
jgi:hypothetical protein